MTVPNTEFRPKSERVRATIRRAKSDLDFGEGTEARGTSLQLQRPHVHRAWGHHPHPHPHLTGPDPSALAVSAAV